MCNGSIGLPHPPHGPNFLHKNFPQVDGVVVGDCVLSQDSLWLGQLDVLENSLDAQEN